MTALPTSLGDPAGEPRGSPLGAPFGADVGADAAVGGADGPAIVAEHLVKRFGSFTAVDDVSFTVHRGEVVGYLGPNGCGKTTTMRMLMGLLRPTSGAATVLGYDIAADAERVRPLVGYMSQRFALYEELTAAENLRFYAGLYDVPAADIDGRIRAVAERVGVAEHLGTRAASLSTGWRQRLALGIALVHAPPLLLLDEPTSGVDPRARRAFWDIIYDLAGEGRTIFVSTHYMDEAEHCHRLGVMNGGRLLALDTPAALKSGAVAGPAWEIIAQPLLPLLGALAAIPGVSQSRLLGDHAHAVTTRGAHDAASLAAALRGLGFVDAVVRATEVTLEDVFMALAGRPPDRSP
ncbi:MAG: ABC transporter ATP-binding protein [Anaerolineae bacterium]